MWSEAELNSMKPGSRSISQELASPVEDGR